MSLCTVFTAFSLEMVGICVSCSVSQLFKNKACASIYASPYPGTIFFSKKKGILFLLLSHGVICLLTFPCSRASCVIMEASICLHSFPPIHILLSTHFINRFTASVSIMQRTYKTKKGVKK